jgi:NADH:ubiquinone reductase (H+-translocating)
VAMQQGRYVANVIAKHLKKSERKPFSYLDKGTMATIGRSRAIAQVGRMKLSGFTAWLAWLFIHLLYLVGYRNRLVVLFNWAWSYVFYKRGARLITQRIPKPL